MAVAIAFAGLTAVRAVGAGIDAPVAANEAGRASSEQWRGFIWDAIPAEALKKAEPDILTTAYQQAGWKPLFITSRFQTDEAASVLLSRLNRLEQEAIDPGPYKLDEIQSAVQKLDAARSALCNADPACGDSRAEPSARTETAPPQSVQRPGEGVSGPNTAQAPDAARQAEIQKLYDDAFRAAADLDIKLVLATVRYAAEMNPSAKEEREKAFSGEIPLAGFIEGLTPSSQNYETLARAYAVYGKLSKETRQPYNGPLKIKHGESGNHIRDLQKRLAQEGLYDGKLSGVFDSETQNALKNFQSAHNVEPDGVIGQRTKDWLNTSFQEKAGLIAQSLRAMRQSPTRGQTRYVRINIPQFMLEYYRDEKVQESHRVVIGKASGKKVKFRGAMVGENQTPTLSSEIEQVIVNPRWYVNDRIHLELNAEAGSDPDYWSKHGYVRMDSSYPGGQKRLFQRPGPKNALGVVKFEFPNPYAVYMHDTPTKHLFARARRDFSHGCIRLDKAVSFAQTLLADDHSRYAQKGDSLFTGERQLFIKLSQPVPIVIEYIPAAANANGQVIFFGDVYGLYKNDSGPKA